MKWIHLTGRKYISDNRRFVIDGQPYGSRTNWKLSDNMHPADFVSSRKVAWYWTERQAKVRAGMRARRYPVVIGMPFRRGVIIQHMTAHVGDVPLVGTPMVTPDAPRPFATRAFLRVSDRLVYVRPDDGVLRWSAPDCLFDCDTHEEAMAFWEKYKSIYANVVLLRHCGQTNTALCGENIRRVCGFDDDAAEFAVRDWMQDNGIAFQVNFRPLNVEYAGP